MSKKYRLVTRSDFDGLVCAVLLKELDLIKEIKFVHPKDMQDEKVEITGNDITTNLPYVRGCHLAFDHHHSETVRAGEVKTDNHIIDPNAPSAARVVFDHYGGAKAFPNVQESLMAAVDKADSGQFSEQEVLEPEGWNLMNFLMDSRTGLGRFREFTVSNYELMMNLIEYCREHSIENILELPDVRERVTLYREHADKFLNQLEECGTVHKNLVVLDLRTVETIFAGNRFMVYAAYPQCNISIHAMLGRNKKNTVFAIGKSILDRSSKTKVGELCLKYGGGGHDAAGTCEVENDSAESVLLKLIEKLTTDG